MAKKHLVVEWLSWLPCKRDFINSTILEACEDIPNTLRRLTLLEQRVHELVGGPLNPPLDNIVGSKRLRSGRVNTLYFQCLLLGVAFEHQLFKLLSLFPHSSPCSHQRVAPALFQNCVFRQAFVCLARRSCPWCWLQLL